MKKNRSSKPVGERWRKEPRLRRTTLRTLIGMHVDHLGDLLKRLDRGERTRTVVPDWKRECAAIAKLEDMFREDLRRKAARS